MKTRKIVVIKVALIVMLSIFALAGCTSTKRHQNSDASIETEFEIQIRQDFVKQSKAGDQLKIQNVWVHKYFGTFNESVVVHMRTTVNLPSAMVVEEVIGFEFWTNTGERILVWESGIFYSLLDAYNDGLLNVDNIENIYQQHQP